MAQHKPFQLGRVPSQSSGEATEDEIPAVKNLKSLRVIIEDIFNSLNFQIAGNCEVLKNLEVSQGTLTEKTIKAFKAEHVDLLINKPVKVTAARFYGLGRVLDNLEAQIKELATFNVSTVGENKPTPIKDTQ